MLLLIRGPNIRKRKEGNDKMYFTIDCFFEYISYFQPHFFSFSFTLLHILMVDTSGQNIFGITLQFVHQEGGQGLMQTLVPLGEPGSDVLQTLFKIDVILVLMLTLSHPPDVEDTVLIVLHNIRIQYQQLALPRYQQV